MTQQIRQLPQKLEFKFAFGSIVIGVPDELGRTGHSGARIAWLNPGDETFGLHAEGAALTRQDDALAILDRWATLANHLQGVGSGDERTTLLDEVTDVERFILSRATPAEGFSALFDLARSAATIHLEGKLHDVHPLPFAVGTLTWLLELAGKYKDDRANACAPEVVRAWEYQLREASRVIRSLEQLVDVEGTCTLHQGVISLPDGSVLRIRDQIFGIGPQCEMTKLEAFLRSAHADQGGGAPFEVWVRATAKDADEIGHSEAVQYLDHGGDLRGKDLGPDGQWKLPEVTESDLEAVKAAGFRVHRGGATDGPELDARWWWTVIQPGWIAVESCPHDFATESEAWADAVRALRADPDLNRKMPDAPASEVPVQLASTIEPDTLLRELRRRRFVVSAWNLNDTTGPLENDDATEGLTDEQFVRLQEKLFEKASVSLEDVLTTRGNQHIADIWDMQRCRMLDEVRGKQAETQAPSLGT
ncbi:hypothetical protein KDW82_08255 [Burkholderia vietnamiensis]|uniref:hypothetical protein n=1 Tax=Burkholderia vietnamiensis TaxID=60552 RepID=UPI001B910236|nr:hypothetical protein [Burkholderia vietnamiensis]MBR8189049.1 hypothetical protein [Burkholderia vietnamiensis]